MNSDDYGFDELDSAVLNELDFVEAEHATWSRPAGHSLVEPIHISSSPEPEPVQTLTSSSTLVNRTNSSANNASLPQNNSRNNTADDTIDIDDFDDDFDDAAFAAMDSMEAAYTSNPTGWKPPPLTRQTTLTGHVLSQTAGAGPSKPSSFHPFGRKASKTKTWDRTEFAASGPRMGKAKGKQRFREDEEDEEEPMEFEQFPAPFVSLGPPPPMKLAVDREEAKTWIYPLNRSKRDYQFNIVRNSLFENSLVALPTGLGKTFIAGVIMLNYYRWFPEGKIVFVAPTKPLVAQQIDASHEACGIPRSDATELTGETPKATRNRLWQTKRVFFMTPQTLKNDLEDENCDVMNIVMLVVDEAHKATGNYAYCQVVRHMMARNPHFRLLALTATPGGNPEAVQTVVDSLHISHIEIRNEESLDLQQYMHKKNSVHTVVPMGGDIDKIKSLLIVAMHNNYQKVLRVEGIRPEQSMVTVHPFIFQQALGNCRQHPWAIPTLRKLGAMARAMSYLMEQSVKMCYDALRELTTNDTNEADQMPFAKKKAPPKKKPAPKRADPDLDKVLREIENQRSHRGGHFPTHPKLDKLLQLMLEHFEQKGDDTRVMVFTTYRACVDEIVAVLDGHRPGLRATRFVGQGSEKAGGKGMAQKEQIAVIKQFKEGVHNILVATSIGEEGLDIGEVDLIICYDSQKTPIRMLQRIGRTGRKRDGRIEVLSAEGREEWNYQKAKDRYKDVQETIVRGDQLELYGDVERLIPEEIKPICVEKEMVIEPYVAGNKLSSESGGTKKAAAAKKKERKTAGSKAKDIPVGAATGFVPVNQLLAKGKGKRKKVDEDEDQEETATLPPRSKIARVTSTKDLAKMVLDCSAADFEAAVTRKRPRKSSDASTKKAPGSKQTLIPTTNKSTKPKSLPFTTEPIVIPDSPNIQTQIVHPPKPSKSSMSWLLSDDEDESGAGPSRPTSVQGFKMPVAPRRPLMEVPAPVGTSPNSSFDISSAWSRRPAIPLKPVGDLPSTPDASKPTRIRRGARENALDGGDIHMSPQARAHRAKPPRDPKFLSRIGNAMFEMEATHSGDDVSEGGLSSDDGEYDQSFVNDGAPTQAPIGYNQEAVYRQSLMTQPAVGVGIFSSGRHRKGPFAGRGMSDFERLRRRRERAGIHGTSSSDPEDIGEYVMGSFVVEDDDEILDRVEEPSSEF